MTKLFSPLKALKAGAISIALAAACLLSSTASAQFIKASGTQIVDGSGRQIFFNGTNLGNWLVWEGYMMMNDGNYRTHTQLFNSMKAAFGNDFAKTREFERQWRLNYVTQETIDELAGLGYNSVRVRFNYKLFWNDATNAPSYEGFEYINNLITYCRAKNMYILLDMHGAPGYQNPGDHSDNVDSNADHPISTVHFLDGTTTGGAIGANVYKAAQVWKHIANYYKGETLIWGYDLLNEPQTGKSPELLAAFRYIRNAIREVDNNHALVVEGDNWASYMDMFKGVPAIDNNVVLETHHYVQGHTEWINDLYGRADIANSLNVPIILGEFGEEDKSILRQMADIGKARYNGTFSWMFKKMYKDRTLWTISPNSASSGAEAAYNNLVNAINWNSTISASTYNDLLTFTAINIRNKAPGLIWGQEFYDATNNPVNNNPVDCNTRSAFKAVSLPGVIQAEDFDKGCANVVFADSTAGNAGGTNYRSTDVDIGPTTDNGAAGYYVGWTTQGEWLEYTVDIPQTGNYVFTYRVATPYSGTSITMTVGSSSTTTNVASTGGWDLWGNTVSAQVVLPAGKQIIRLTFSGGLNLNSFSAAVISNKLPVVAIAAGRYTIVSNLVAASGSYIGKSLDVAKLSGNSTPVKLWDAWGAGGDNQEWDIQPNGDAYTIKNVNTGKGLDVPVNTTTNLIDRNTLIQQYDVGYYPGNNQRWKFSRTADGSFVIISAFDESKALDVPNGNTVNGSATIQVYDVDAGNRNQQWRLNKIN